MNWRLLVGKSLNHSYEAMLRLPGFPLTNAVAFGRVWPYDVMRFARTRDLKLIFDVGANIGQTALHLRRFLPRATIHSFEPVPATCTELRRNTAGHPTIQVHPLAMSNATGETDIFVTDNSQLSSLEAREGQTAVRIRTQTVDDFCAEQGITAIDILKMDVEGHELGVIEGARGMLDAGRIRCVYGEVGFGAHDGGHTPFPDFHATMLARGFEFAGLYEPWRDPPNRHRYEFASAMYWNPNYRVETAD